MKQTLNSVLCCFVYNLHFYPKPCRDNARFIITQAYLWKMFNKNYSNFVRPTSPTEEVSHSNTYQFNTSLTGDEARRIYLEEVREANTVKPSSSSVNYLSYSETRRPTKHKSDGAYASDKDLFRAAQSNDVDTIKDALSLSPDKINITDDYGWSLLMIACQANSVDTVKELLKRGIDITVRDKAGNSAQSLVIKNKNFVLADVLISHRQKQEETQEQQSKVKVKLKEFQCSVCNQVYPDEQEHLSSTIHNINASKGKKIPTNYGIPQSNRGYQIMLKVGWDRDSGLGPEGTGKKYPIKAVQKKDRKGLGHVKKDKEEPKQETVKHKNRKSFVREYESSKKMEINFRRQFY